MNGRDARRAGTNEASVAFELIPYGGFGDRVRHLHVWRPAADGKAHPPARPMILDLHGGAWTHFTPAVDRFWCRRLAESGFLVASAEVRLSGEAPFPACADDAVEAARWLRRNGASIGGDPERLGVMGGSTGGHLALLTALHGRDPLAGDDRSLVDGVVALWPVVDVLGRYRHVRDTTFGPLATWVADRAGASASASVSTSGNTNDPTADRLGQLDDLRRHHPVLGDALGFLVQRMSWLAGVAPPSRATLYRQLVAAHDAAFGHGDAADALMLAASPVRRIINGHLPDHLPPLLLVQGMHDPNISMEASRELVETWRRAGGDAALEGHRWVGHSYGNVASRESDRLVDRIVVAIADWWPEVPVGETPAASDAQSPAAEVAVA